MPTTGKPPPRKASASGKIAGVACTVLGGVLGLWVIARLSSVMGWQQTWAPPLTPYEWTTLGGTAVSALLLFVGLVRLTKPAPRDLD